MCEQTQKNVKIKHCRGKGITRWWCMIVIVVSMVVIMDECHASSADLEEDDKKEANSSERCRWGSAECHHHHHHHSSSSSENSTGNTPTLENTIPFVKTATTTTGTTSGTGNHKGGDGGVVVVSSSSSRSKQQHEPPEGLELNGHVVTKSDGRSYFLDSSDRIPYLECGAIGSTTSPVSVKHLTFRHFPNGAEPSEWSTVHVPTLCIPLTPMEVQTSSGESRIFEAGSVILLEDTMGQGHKLKSAASTTTNSNNNNNNNNSNNNHQHYEDLMAAMISLPNHHHYHHYYHDEDDENPTILQDNYFSRLLFGLTTPSKQQQHSSSSHNSRSFFFRRKKPCQLEQDPNYTTSSITKHQKMDDVFIMKLMGNDQTIMISKRRLLLSAIGITVSSSLAYFLSKVAPLQLAVGVGGACMIGAGTTCIVKTGEYLLDEFTLWLDEKHLQKSQTQQQQQEEDLSAEDNEEDTDTINNNATISMDYDKQTTSGQSLMTES